MEDRLQSFFACIQNRRPSLGGKILYYLIPFKKGRIEKNLAIVYGDQIDASSKKIFTQLIYSHLFSLVKENIIGMVIGPKGLSKQVEIVGGDEAMNVYDPKRGCILLTGHFGNWENAVLGASIIRPDLVKLFCIVRRQFKNKFFEKIIFGRFIKVGMEVLGNKNVIMKVCDLLAQGKGVVFTFDQHASPENKDGIAVEFFGKKAGTYRSVAMITRYSNCTVVPIVCYRKPDGKHIMEFFPPLPYLPANEEGDEIYRNTKQYNEFIEKMILKYPDQWACWLHRRWKLKEPAYTNSLSID